MLSSAKESRSVCYSVHKRHSLCCCGGFRCTVRGSLGFMYWNSMYTCTCSSWTAISCFASHLCAALSTVGLRTHARAHTHTRLQPFLHLSAHAIPLTATLLHYIQSLCSFNFSLFNSDTKPVDKISPYLYSILSFFLTQKPSMPHVYLVIMACLL